MYQNVKMKPMNRIKLIIGPTAIGKSDYAIDLAKQSNAHIISADAFQVYKGMDIGTGKISPVQQAIVPHHLIDIKEPNQPYNAAEFVRLANQLIESISSPIIICGGTGMYINALLNNYTFQPPSSTVNAKEIVSSIKSQDLWKTLNKIDPQTASSIHKNNHIRLQRALEIWYSSQTKPSVYNEQRTQRSDITIIGLISNRHSIRDRISNRIDRMINDGLFDEVHQLIQRYDKNGHAFQAIGYKQIIQYLDNKLTKEQAIELIKVKSYQFAKRQLTWFRKFHSIDWISV